jgi:phosphoribosylaminoimidazolecarboxamide formyltransferase / IMP cyclohydrolase
MHERRLALLSVSDKRGIETLARGLVDFGFDLLSTGGTAKAIAAAGLPVTAVSDYTGAPEIMDGRVKTLHPKVHGGILARATDEHLADLKRIHGGLIDIVVVNLYPFESTASSPSAKLPEVVEQIDIGGPCLLRAAAKNFERVTTICDPYDYEVVLWHLAKEGAVPESLRYDLAVKAFGHTAAYDAAIFQTLPQFDLASSERRGARR